MTPEQTRRFFAALQEGADFKARDGDILGSDGDPLATTVPFNKTPEEAQSEATTLVEMLNGYSVLMGIVEANRAKLATVLDKRTLADIDRLLRIEEASLTGSVGATRQ